MRAGQDTGWHAPAAYLYILSLGTSQIAWEYLRRNRSYVGEWQRVARDFPDTSAAHWGLVKFESPERDARESTPCWGLMPHRFEYLLPAEDAGSTPFHLWDFEGRKALRLDRGEFQCSVRVKNVRRTIRFPHSLVDGTPYIAMVPDRRTGVEATGKPGVDGGDIRLKPHSRLQTERGMLLHMRTVHALDADSANASHRQMAEAIFGKGAVQRRWGPDGELRAQIRYLLRRGKSFCGGEYRRLVDDTVVVSL